MFGKRKIVRLALWACLAATGLPLGTGLLSPTRAHAEEVVPGGPLAPAGPVARVEPRVRIEPLVTVEPRVRIEPIRVVEPVRVVAPIRVIEPIRVFDPIVRVGGPIYSHPWRYEFEHRGFYGYHGRR